MNLPCLKLLQIFLFLPLSITSERMSSAEVMRQTRAGPRRPTTVALHSPNWEIEVVFRVADWEGRRGVPLYRVNWNGKPLIGDSNLGLEFKGSGALSGLVLKETQHRSADSTYTMPFGKNREVRDRYEEYSYELEEMDGTHRRIDLVFRLYNDGVAFRYSIPKQIAFSDFVITEEQTGVVLAGKPKMYALPLVFGSAYEAYYRIGTVDQFKPGETLGLPLLLEYPGGPWVGFTEADLTDYAGMYVTPSARQASTLETRLAPWPGEPAVKVRGTAPFQSPWRVLIIGQTPGTLLESDLITHLNTPTVVPDVSWIRPGKVQFPWWNGYVMPGDHAHRAGLNTWTLKRYIDFCAAHGIENHSIDGYDFDLAWYGGPVFPYGGADITKPIPEIDLPGVLRYAKERGVGTRLWMHWEGLAQNVDSILETYESWGIEGIMVDFLSRDDQEMVRWYREILRKTAQHHLTVAVHGVFKPTGQTRTYPHLLNHEAVLGTEYNKWKGPGSLPEHEVLVAFIRMMAGPVDTHQGSFRPVALENYHPSYKAPRAIGTLARQLALYVVYENRLPMVADYPEAYEQRPEAFGFVKNVPAYWDEIRVLAGEVGHYIAIARRRGTEWYLGTITDRSPRKLKIPLGFLGPGHFVAEVYSDGPNPRMHPEQVIMKKLEVTSATELLIELAPAGGNAVRIYRKQ